MNTFSHKTVTNQKQQQKLQPAHLQFLNILRMNQHELEQYMVDESYLNPFLEVKYDESPQSTYEDQNKQNDVYDDTGIPHYLKDSYAKEQTLDHAYIDVLDKKQDYVMSSLSNEQDTIDQLKSQLPFSSLTEEELLIGEYILDSLDDFGFLKVSIDDLSDELSFRNNKWYDEKSISQVLEKIKELDGIGLACFDLKEFLEYQLENSKSKNKIGANLAITIVKNHWQLLEQQQYKKIALTMDITEDQINDAVEIIKQLRPYPMADSIKSDIKSQYIQPDFIITMDDQGKLHTNHTKSYIDLSINNHIEVGYKDAKDNSIKKYLTENKNKAEEVISNITSRKKTLGGIMQYIVHVQHKYFVSGDPLDIVPMSLQDIANETKYDLSTISRSTSSKYAIAPFGLIPLKSLFHNNIGINKDSSFTPMQVKEKIATLIRNEHKNEPYTDLQLSELLFEEGIDIGRRTVANYRQDQNIKSSEQRKQENNDQNTNN